MKTQKLSLGLIIFSVVVFVTPNLVARADSLMHVKSNTSSKDISASASKNVYLKVNYPNTLKDYVKAEVKNYMNIKGLTNLSNTSLNNLTKDLTEAIAPKYSDTNFDFLRVDKFRAIIKPQYLEQLMPISMGGQQYQKQLMVLLSFFR